VTNGRVNPPSLIPQTPAGALVTAKEMSVFLGCHVRVCYPDMTNLCAYENGHIVDCLGGPVSSNPFI